MAAEGQESGERRPGKRKRGEHRASLIAAIAHPVRRRVLRAVAGEEPRRPVQMAEELGSPASMVAYHARVLRRLGAIKPAAERDGEGHLEHLYESTIEDDPPIETLLEETREADEESE